MHYLARRPEERITFDIQKTLGEKMQYKNGPVASGVESFMKDAKFKKGSGYALQRMWQGSDERSHRLLWWGPLGNRGRAEDGYQTGECA